MGSNKKRRENRRRLMARRGHQDFEGWERKQDIRYSRSATNRVYEDPSWEYSSPSLSRGMTAAINYGCAGLVLITGLGIAHIFDLWKPGKESVKQDTAVESRLERELVLDSWPENRRDEGIGIQGIGDDRLTYKMLRRENGLFDLNDPSATGLVYNKIRFRYDGLQNNKATISFRHDGDHYVVSSIELAKGSDDKFREEVRKLFE